MEEKRRGEEKLTVKQPEPIVFVEEVAPVFVVEPVPAPIVAPVPAPIPAPIPAPLPVVPAPAPVAPVLEAVTADSSVTAIAGSDHGCPFGFN